MKVLFLTNIPAPYRIDFFNELGKECELTVLFERNDARDRNEQWLSKKSQNFKSVYLKGIKIGADSVISFEVIKYLDKKKYAIIICAYSTPTGMIAINYMKMRRISFGLNSDGGFIKKRESFVKRLIKRYYISSAGFWLSTGKLTTSCLVFYGANPKRVFTYLFTSLHKKEILESPVDENTQKRLKSKLNINEEKFILSVGQYIHRKGFDVLLRACKDISSEYGVYFVGGEPTEEYLKLKKEFNLTNVHFIGFKSKDELKDYYMVSDLFVLPTREDIWGLVVNEAMANGLPVITTDKCVAGLELVKDNENGYIIPVGDEKSLAEKINVILNNDELREKMAKSSLEKIKDYTIEKMAKTHIEIFKEILKKRIAR